MGSSESEANSGHVAVGNGPKTVPVPSEGDRPRARRQVQIWAIALAAGVAAGVLAWVGGELAYGTFKPQLFPQVLALGQTVMAPTPASLKAADIKNATLAFAILGGVTGLVMGFAGGLAGRSLSRGVIVGLGAQALGVLVGALASLAFVPFFHRELVPDTNDLLSPIVIDSGIWAAIGAVGGLAFAIGMRCGRHLLRAIGAASLGAILAAVVFHLVSGGLFPDSGSTEPVATSSFVRLLAMLLVTVLVAAGAARGAQGRVSVPASGVTHQ